MLTVILMRFFMINDAAMLLNIAAVRVVRPK
jgi:hypothetical protein